MAAVSHPGATRPAPAAGADRTIRGRGRPDSHWQRWAGWQQGSSCSLTDLVTADQRLVVVAPHPDDEVLAAGGLIRQAVSERRRVRVIGVTDGGASHPGSALWPPDRLVRQRRRERLQALEILGLDEGSIQELGLPDGGITAASQQLVERLSGLLEADDVVISPWRYDGHPDHEATAEAVRQAAAARAARQLQAPIWGWHWADPQSEELPAAGALLVMLDEHAQAAKSRAIGCFQSQLDPDPSTGAAAILPDWALRRFSRRYEVLLP